MERRIERLEKTKEFSEHGIRVIIKQSQGYLEATDEQVARALKKYNKAWLLCLTSYITLMGRMISLTMRNIHPGLLRRCESEY